MRMKFQNFQHLTLSQINPYSLTLKIATTKKGGKNNKNLKIAKAIKRRQLSLNTLLHKFIEMKSVL
jgi:hypothetical protein